MTTENLQTLIRLIKNITIVLLAIVILFEPLFARNLTNLINLIILIAIAMCTVFKILVIFHPKYKIINKPSPPDGIDPRLTEIVETITDCMLIGLAVFYLLSITEVY